MNIHYVFNRQKLSADMEKQSNTLIQLQGRFKHVKIEKEAQVKNVYSELEDSLTTLVNYKQQ